MFFPAVPLKLLAFFTVTGNSTVHNTIVQTKIAKSEPHAALIQPQHETSLNFSLQEMFNSLVTAKMHPLHSFVEDKCKSPKETVSSKAQVESSAVTETVCLCLSPHSLPTAWGQDDKRQAGMGLWALDCRSPACFHVVSIQPEAGHCYRFNNRNDYKTQTVCILVLALMGRPFPNSLIHLHEKCGDRIVTIICRASCSPFKRRRATAASSSSRWNVHSGDEKKKLWLKWFR